MPVDVHVFHSRVAKVMNSLETRHYPRAAISFWLIHAPQLAKDHPEIVIFIINPSICNKPSEYDYARKTE